MLTDWEMKVLEFVRRIPHGRLMTYKTLAASLGDERGARAVGNALRKNPYSFIATDVSADQQIPCHRVVRSDGNIGWYAGSSQGKKHKRRLLESEGIMLRGDKVCDLENHLVSYDKQTLI